MGTLVGRTALVTGGSRGIGRAIAERLAREGALVAVHYGSDEEAATQTVATIKSGGGRAFLIRAKFGEAGDAAALWESFDRGVAEFTDLPGLDIVVNNAGIVAYAAIGDTAEKDFDDMFAVNVKAPLFILKHGLHRLRDGGRIINITSAAARIAVPMTIAYSMTKAALNVLTHTLAQELGPRGITVNAVAPGVVDTDLVPWLADPQLRERTAALSAFDRIGDPVDIADVVAFLASPDARWVTGQTIDATGGTLLGVTI
ncbi:3-oxoacyl-[acyl-carrier protein] reductase [Parafrankia irregularis]|uniref:3-oxoacyl-[acyl-carrier protein] reductase n=1 Tax=Parafrankia irregularis TaxID=795642 RepID=A0A0S4QYW0_9ACTN|nr:MULTISPECIES: SDR family oxidoreductase [Parafrankia]MBE3202301.1 SDR family oxidoreductase [Parafrankia sp. CH37]CUU59734.1 3-oxoacyl-[acyl-carrier protein] reductase [Parafrankia irregularis]